MKVVVGSRQEEVDAVRILFDPHFHYISVDASQADGTRTSDDRRSKRARSAACIVMLRCKSRLASRTSLSYFKGARADKERVHRSSTLRELGGREMRLL